MRNAIALFFKIEKAIACQFFPGKPDSEGDRLTFSKMSSPRSLASLVHYLCSCFRQ
ncbi:MAG: hypothetical protein F6J93_08650 [Oscillatoria sp. SIO1A7]|nr:hypothetical protein [Oscillatoria sp. SIO1A7]